MHYDFNIFSSQYDDKIEKLTLCLYIWNTRILPEAPRRTKHLMAQTKLVIISS